MRVKLHMYFSVTMRKRVVWGCVVLALLAGACTITDVKPETRTPTPTLQLEPVLPLEQRQLQPTLAPTWTVGENIAPTPTLGASPPTSAPTPEHPYTEHTVQAGETLLGLAMMYDVPMAAIQLQNQLGTSTVVKVGQVLVIPPKAAWEGASLFWVVHVVEAGETLSAIADLYDLDVTTLQAVNALDSADFIEVGQALVLPLQGLAGEVAQVPEPTSPPPPAMATPVPASSEPESSPEQPPQPVPTPVPVSGDVAAWPYETFRLINKVRAEYGLLPFVYNETLAQAAQLHAQDCQQRQGCSHTGSDGSNIKVRVVRAGYEPAGWAECWALRDSPQGTVDVWMNETPPNDPHRRTLLSTWLTEIGLGVAEAYGGYYYFIADFGRPK